MRATKPRKTPLHVSGQPLLGWYTSNRKSDSWRASAVTSSEFRVQVTSSVHRLDRNLETSGLGTIREVGSRLDALRVSGSVAGIRSGVARTVASAEATSINCPGETNTGFAPAADRTTAPTVPVASVSGSRVARVRSRLVAVPRQRRFRAPNTPSVQPPPEMARFTKPARMRDPLTVEHSRVWCRDVIRRTREVVRGFRGTIVIPVYTGSSLRA